MAKENQEQPTVDTTHVGESLQAESGVEQFLETHIKKVLLVGLGLVIGVGAWIFVNESGKAKEAAAAEAFTKAFTTADLEKVSTEHAGTAGGGNALLMIADRNITTGKYDDARIRLEEFLANYPKHPRRAQAQFSLGVVAESTGKNKEAEEYFQAVADSGSELGPLAMIRVANLQSAAGDPAKAKTTLDGIMGRFVGNPFIEFVADRRDAVKMEIAVGENPAPAYKWPEAPKEEEAKPTAAGDSLIPAPELSTIPVPPGSVPTDAASTPAIEIPSLSDLGDRPKPAGDAAGSLLDEAPSKPVEKTGEAEKGKAPATDSGGESSGG